jgi:5-methyltetrahydropteroyltriglutamate--homocysteine methyltransferase
MKLSTDRILTTHVGSLPRPQPLVELLIKKDRDQPYDKADFEAQVTKAVADIVARQVAIGIDVVSDGEASKVGYATYVHERLTGFGGEPFTPKPNRDVADYPDFRRRLELFIGPQQIRRLCCIGDIARQDHESAKRDIDNFKAAIAASKPVDAFMPAASPGVVSTFQPNRHYPNHAAYIGAIASAMQAEYEAIANAGIVVQLDSPDLAMARHTGFQDLTEAEFLKQA